MPPSFIASCTVASRLFCNDFNPLPGSVAKIRSTLCSSSWVLFGLKYTPTRGATNGAWLSQVVCDYMLEHWIFHESTVVRRGVQTYCTLLDPCLPRPSVKEPSFKLSRQSFTQLVWSCFFWLFWECFCHRVIQLFFVRKPCIFQLLIQKQRFIACWSLDATSWNECFKWLYPYRALDSRVCFKHSTPKI